NNLNGLPFKEGVAAPNNDSTLPAHFGRWGDIDSKSASHHPWSVKPAVLPAGKHDPFDKPIVYCSERGASPTLQTARLGDEHSARPPACALPWRQRFIL